MGCDGAMGLGVRERGKGRRRGGDVGKVRDAGARARRGMQGHNERRGVMVGRGGKMHNAGARGHWKARGAKGVRVRGVMSRRMGYGAWRGAREYGKAKRIKCVMGREGIWEDEGVMGRDGMRGGFGREKGHGTPCGVEGSKGHKGGERGGMGRRGEKGMMQG